MLSRIYTRMCVAIFGALAATTISNPSFAQRGQAEAFVKDRSQKAYVRKASTKAAVTFIDSANFGPADLLQAKGAIVVRGIINDTPCYIMIDTGSDRTIVSEKLLPVLKYEKLIDGPLIRLSGSSLRSRTGAEFTLSVPKQVSFSGPVLVADISKFAGALGPPIGVILGMDYLSSTSILFQFSKSRVYLSQPGSIKPRQNVHVITLSESVGVPARVDGRDVQLTIDSGYNGAVRLFGKPSRGSAAAKQKEGRMELRPDGSLAKVSDRVSGTVQIGDLPVSSNDVIFGPGFASKGDGLIGTRYLAQFDVIIDYQGRTAAFVSSGASTTARY